VQDGALVVEKGGGGGDIVSKEQYGDVALAFDFRLTSKANSGVMYRVAEDQDETYYTGPEFQVLADDYFDGAVDMMHSAGSLYAITPATGGKLVPTGEWNRGLVVLRGWVEHWLAACAFRNVICRARKKTHRRQQLPRCGFAKHDRGSSRCRTTATKWPTATFESAIWDPNRKRARSISSTARTSRAGPIA
jgi:hypothetical protein